MTSTSARSAKNPERACDDTFYFYRTLPFRYATAHLDNKGAYVPCKRFLRKLDLEVFGSRLRKGSKPSRDIRMSLLFSGQLPERCQILSNF